MSLLSDESRIQMLEERITKLEKYVEDNHARIRGLRDANKELWEYLKEKGLI